MLHYYFFKYWSRGLVSLMISIIVGYFGLFSYSLFAANNAQRQALSESAKLSVTPPLKQNLTNDPETQTMYKKSVHLYAQIQKLKENKKDTSELETLYGDSVKDLTSQHKQAAEIKLQKIETKIATINETITPSPTPSEIPANTTNTTVTPSPSVSPSPSVVPSVTPTENTTTNASSSATHN